MPSASLNGRFLTPINSTFISQDPKYAFEYGVYDDYYNTNFGHRESRDNDLTKGSYFVHLPDGRLQKVTYYVDGYSGYVAEVTYEGEARYDDSSSSGYDD